MEKEDSQKGWCTDFKQQHQGPKKSNRPSAGFGKVRGVNLRFFRHTKAACGWETGSKTSEKIDFD